ncbi:MAG: hypothetical protein AAB728_04445 [Patescibacteria group bacterium]
MPKETFHIETTYDNTEVRIGICSGDPLPRICVDVDSGINAIFHRDTLRSWIGVSDARCIVLEGIRADSSGEVVFSLFERYTHLALRIRLPSGARWQVHEQRVPAVLSKEDVAAVASEMGMVHIAEVEDLARDFDMINRSDAEDYARGLGMMTAAEARARYSPGNGRVQKPRKKAKA